MGIDAVIRFIVMQKGFWYYRRQKSEVQKKVELPEGVTIKKCIPHPYVDGMSSMLIGRKKFFYYQLFTFLFRGFKRVFVEYDIIKDGNIVTQAVLISKVPVYPFLPPKGVHLGYCETLERERGKGYYPLLLRHIQYDNPMMDLHMIVSENNYASIRGIEKAGFVRYAYGIKSENGRFIINKYL